MISLQTFFNNSNQSFDSEITKSTNSRNSNYIISNYEIKKIIGQGTFSDVFITKKKTNGKIYAIKIVKKQYLNKMGIKSHIITQKFINSFLNEKKIMTEIDHPFVNKIEDSFTNKNTYYLVSKFYQGGELQFHLNKVGRFNEKATKFYTSQILLALEYLHSQNIIFREYII